MTASVIKNANVYIINSEVVYFIYVIMSSSAFLMWLLMIFIVWLVLIRERVERSLSTENDKKVVDKITRGMVSSLVGFGLWSMKMYLIKYIASSFQRRKFFGRVRDAIYFKYVVQKLNKKIKSDGSSDKGIDYKYEWKYVKKLNETKQDGVSAIYMTQLIERLSVMNLLEKKKIEYDVTSESEASTIFDNIKELGEESMYEFLSKEAIIRISPIFNKGTANNKLTQEASPSTEASEASPSSTESSEVVKTPPPPTSSKDVKKPPQPEFIKWMMGADKELRNLACCLKDSKSAIDELNVIVSVLVLVVIVIVWLLLMGITTTEVLVLISSQLLVWSFVFGGTFKGMLDGIIFNFVAHPFDVGDQCEINGQKMTVEEMGLLSTEFDGTIEGMNKKIHYSNSALCGIPIINFTKTSSMEEVSRIWKSDDEIST